MDSSYFRRAFQIAAFLLVGDIVFFSLTNPRNDSNSLIIILGSALVGLTFYWLARLAIAAFNLKHKASSYTLTKQKRLSILTAVLATILILMRSVGQLDIKDGIVILSLVAISYFYISYAGGEATQKK